MVINHISKWSDYNVKFICCKSQERESKLLEVFLQTIAIVVPSVQI